MLLITEMRRKRLLIQPFPPAWNAILERNVPLYHRLPPADRTGLKGVTQIILAEKNFEGGDGLVITDEIRVTIAAQASILLLHRRSDYYPGLSSIIVYPYEYLAPFLEMDEWGVVTEGTDQRSGESGQEGALVLSWEDVVAEGIDVHEGYNVVLHEFAHQLDAEEGITTGRPMLPGRSGSGALADILSRERDRLHEEAVLGRKTVLDPYGAENSSELFAVATEAFFQIPCPLREHHPELYCELSRFYRQNPAAWLPSIRTDPSAG